MPTKVTAYIALGSNLNNPIQQITDALDNLQRDPSITLKQTSSIYKSHPQGPQDQPDYYNAVCAIQTNKEPLALLDSCQYIETKQGRIRTRHWGERTIDMDILLYNNTTFRSKRLIIPHPQMKNRLFVLLPLLEIVNKLTLPDQTDLTRHVNNMLLNTPKKDIPIICPLHTKG